MTSSTALTVIMPLNPVFARLLSTATFPLNFAMKRGAHMFLTALARHGKVLEIDAFLHRCCATG
ncbi:MAG TPA: hypothetical protein VJT70_01845 [Sphingomicrobium sp.]|nr:hypothetical protein [Sphingomicrobium sp.]